MLCAHEMIVLIIVVNTPVVLVFFGILCPIMLVLFKVVNYAMQFVCLCILHSHVPSVFKVADLPVLCAPFFVFCAHVLRVDKVVDLAVFHMTSCILLSSMPLVVTVKDEFSVCELCSHVFVVLNVIDSAVVGMAFHIFRTYMLVVLEEGHRSMIFMPFCVLRTHEHVAFIVANETFTFLDIFPAYESRRAAQHCERFETFRNVSSNQPRAPQVDMPLKRRFSTGSSAAEAVSKDVKIGGVAKKPRSVPTLLGDLEKEDAAFVAEVVHQAQNCKQEAEARARATSNLIKTYTCPLSLSLMIDPVTMADGHSYERKEAEKYIKVQQRDSAVVKSPSTRKALANTDLTPNMTLRIAIETTIEAGHITGELVDEYKETVAQRKRDKRKVESLTYWLVSWTLIQKTKQQIQQAQRRK